MEEAYDGPEPPAWFSNHPALKARDIVLGYDLKRGCVWRTLPNVTDRPPYAVKILDEKGTEAAFYEELLGYADVPQNHTLPCEIVRSGGSILIMPALTRYLPLAFFWDLTKLLEFFVQMLEGIEFLHSLHIAHMDIYSWNVLWAEDGAVKFFPHLEALKPGRVYIIDYERSAHYPAGPGQQTAVDLPETATDPPLGMRKFDPYSWDMYCVGSMFSSTMRMTYYQRSPHWLADRLVKWIVGEERGCIGICRCRPLARTARRVCQIALWYARVAAVKGRVIKWLTLMRGGESSKQS